MTSGLFMKLKFSERSKAHLRQIHSYTLENFGPRQVAVYRGALSQGLATQRRFPTIGLASPDLPEGVRAFRLKEHWICYAVFGDTIQIEAFIQSLPEFRVEDLE